MSVTVRDLLLERAAQDLFPNCNPSVLAVNGLVRETAHVWEQRRLSLTARQREVFDALLPGWHLHVTALFIAARRLA